MYKIKVFLILLFPIVAKAQNTGSKNDLTVHQQQVKQTIQEFFEGFHKGDTAIINRVISPTIVLQTVAKNKEGVVKMIQTPKDKFLNTIHNRPEDQKWDERLLDFTIIADAQIANAWTPYEFYFNGNFSHCGVNVFQLYKDENGWRIMHLADTRNREGCQDSGE